MLTYMHDKVLIFVVDLREAPFEPSTSHQSYRLLILGVNTSFLVDNQNQQSLVSRPTVVMDMGSLNKGPVEALFWS